MFRFLVCIGVAALIFFAVIMLGIAFESSYLLENWYDVSPLPNVKQGVWLAQFQASAFDTACIALAFAMIWNLVGYFGYRIKDWSQTGGWHPWWLIGAAMAVTVWIYGWINTAVSQDDGRLLATTLYFINSIIIYWFSSLVLSPASVKYVPPFSRYMPTQRISLNF